MNSHNVCIVGVVACAGVSSMASAQNNLLSVRPIGPLSSVEPLFVLPDGRVQSAPAMMGTEAVGPTVFFDDFSTYTKTDYTNPPMSFVSLDLQANPFGVGWGTGSNFFGAATLGIMQAGGGAHPVGDSPAFGPIACFAAAARKTGLDLIDSNSNILATCSINNLIVPQMGDPMVIAQDIYLSSVDNQPHTNLWWSPLSLTEGFILDRMFYGGTHLSGSLSFGLNSSGVLDRFVSLGPAPNIALSIFYASAQHPNFPPPVNEWFTLMAHMSLDGTGAIGYSLWVKSPESVASNPPFIDPRMAIGDIPPVDNNPVGWVNIYPGFPDDNATPNVIEGIGLGASATGAPSPNTGPLGQAPPLAALSFNEIEYGTGLDDPTNPNFVPDDYFFANFRVGVVTPCLSDLNGDGVVDSADLANLLTAWGATGVIADINGDGVVDSADLANLLTNWGPCPI